MKGILVLIILLFLLGVGEAENFLPKANDPCPVGPWLESKIYPPSPLQPSYFWVAYETEEASYTMTTQAQAVEGGVRMHLSISAFPPGTYTLRVRACRKTSYGSSTCEPIVFMPFTITW